MAKRKMAEAPLPTPEVQYPKSVTPDLPKDSEFPMDQATFQKTVMDTLIKLVASNQEIKQGVNQVIKVARSGKF